MTEQIELGFEIGATLCQAQTFLQKQSYPQITCVRKQYQRQRRHKIIMINISCRHDCVIMRNGATTDLNRFAGG